MTYLLLSNFAVLVFYLIYRLGLRKLTFFSLNRWYLLSSLFIAYVVPLLLFTDFSVPRMMEISLPRIDITLNQGTALENVDSSINQSQFEGWNAVNWVNLCYWLGVLITMGMLAFRLLTVLKGRYAAQHKGSFSFFNFVRIADEDLDNGFIQRHEQVHVNQKHSYDILFVELIRAFNWFNPVLLWIRNDLKFQHECIVDDHFSENKIAYAELLVANAMHIAPHQLSHEFSNKTILKERIKMIFKAKSKSKNRLFYLSILPVAVLLLGITINCKSPEKDKVNSEAKSSEESGQDSPISTINPSAGGFQTVEYDSVDVKPTYPGGINQFRREFQQSIVYTQEAIDGGAKGTVELSFIIDKTGKVVDIKVVKDVGFGLGQEAVRSLNNLKDWEPGTYQGEPVNVKYHVPVRFDLSKM